MGVDARQRRWQFVTASMLLVGYAGYYVCRSNLSVVAPELVREFGSHGVDRAGIGLIVSSGVMAYAVGKILMGIWGDFLGGRAAFVGGMVASVLATVAFGVGSALPVFIGIWMVNRFVQSIGWGALVKIAAHWFEPARYGRVMAILSLSFLFGDAAGRFLLGRLMASGFGWRAVFFASAATLGLIATAAWALLRNSPEDMGLPAPPVSDANLFGEAGAGSAPSGIGDLLNPFLRSPSFWAICAVSLGLTLIRETFNAWTPTYLVDVYGLSQADAAQKSSLFPLVGGVSVLVVGRLSDRAGASTRLVVTLPLLATAVIALGLIGSPIAMESQATGLVLLGVVAFLVIGPYSLLAGAMAIDLGGRRGSATAAGLIDSAGYIGGVLSGWAVGALAERAGWAAAFRVLAVVAAGAAASAVLYGILQRRGSARRRLRHATGELA
jgi:MFS transporter, OPA family, glycerol-3-phosphate transporter